MNKYVYWSRNIFPNVCIPDDANPAWIPEEQGSRLISYLQERYGGPNVQIFMTVADGMTKDDTWATCGGPLNEVLHDIDDWDNCGI